MNATIKNGGEYYNKGYRCLWVELHDGTTHKFIISDLESSTPIAPADWHIASDSRDEAIKQELLDGAPILDIQHKYHMDDRRQ